MRDDCGWCEGTASAVLLLDQLADQRRLTILWHLAQGGKTTDELVAATGLDPRAVAKELRH
jgi:DNA-binding transcriptional ArsR family regulator